MRRFDVEIVVIFSFEVQTPFLLAFRIQGSHDRKRQIPIAEVLENFLDEDARKPAFVHCVLDLGIPHLAHIAPIGQNLIRIFKESLVVENLMEVEEKTVILVRVDVEVPWLTVLGFVVPPPSRQIVKRKVEDFVGAFEKGVFNPFNMFHRALPRHHYVAMAKE